MPKERRSLGPGRSRTTFTNGTTVASALGGADVTQWTAGGRARTALRPPAERDIPPELETALSDLGIRDQETIDLDLVAGARALRRTPSEDRVVVTPAPAPDGIQVVLYIDESGGMSWHLPDGHGKRRRAGSARSGMKATFTIDTRTAAAQRSLARQRTGSVLRGPITKLGRKIFKVLVVPVTKLLAKPVAAIVGKIEQKHRQELVRELRPENYRTRLSEEFSGWRGLASGRSLLVIHGLFSTTEGVLSQLPDAAMRELHRRYEGRVIAFDQLTVTHSPEDNARFFLRRLREGNAGGRIDFDILCHSRGGIVARMLAERGRELDPAADCAFRKVYFVASPNAGSPLANPEHMVDMIDVFTNMITNFPDGPVTYSIEVVLAILKLLVATAERHLPGLAAMGTSGFIADLNASRTASPAEYAAACADYEPDPQHDNGFFTGKFADTIIDRVFEGEPNDLVVPRNGVAGDNGHPSFPIDRTIAFEAKDRIWHSGFFSEERALDHMMEFLAGRERFAAAKPRGRAPAEVFDELAAGFESGASESARGAPEEEAREDEPVPASTPRPRKFGAKKGVKKARARRSAAKKMRSRAPRPGAPSTARLPERTVRRNPHIDFHELVFAGKKNPLVVRLSDVVSPAERERAFTVGIGKGRASIDVRVSLSAPGFDVEPQSDQTLTIFREYDEERERVTFQLSARDPGPELVTREIRADIWLGNSCLGAVTHYTNVAPAGYRGALRGDGRSRSEPFALLEDRKDCDLVIRVEGKDEPGKPPFNIRMDCGMPGERYDGKFLGRLDFSTKDIGGHMQGIFDVFVKKYPEGGDEKALTRWRRNLVLAIDDLGKDLWKRLPQQFRDEYFRLLDAGLAPRSIQVHSDEMIIPWELVIPHRQSTGALKPLGIAHVMGRWRPGLPIRPPSQRMAIAGAAILNPKYPNNQLWWSVLEAQELKTKLPVFMEIRPADLDTVETLLARDDIQLFHYTGHGQYKSKDADLSTLELEGTDSLPATSFIATALLTKGRSILYLNACGVGSSGVVLGKMGGFAATCLEEGSSGVIAPYWSVSDESAKRFSLAFYDKLLRGRTIGKALQELRSENAADPTFQAFSYFGDPWTRAQFTDAPGRSTTQKRGGSKGAKRPRAGRKGAGRKRAGRSARHG